MTATKVMYATKLWLEENLHLQTSDEKSGITNLRKNYTTFLGIKFKVVPKGKKWIIRSHMADKSKANLENGRAEDVDLAGQEKEEQSRVAEDSPYHTRPPGKEGR